MKLIKFAPLALAVFSAAASADMFTANLYDVNNINQDVIDSRLSMSGPLFNGWDRTFKQGDPWVEAYGMTHRINRTGDFGKFKNKGAGGVFGYDHVIADNFRLGLALNGGAGKLKWYNDEDEGDLKLDSHWYGVNLYGTWTGKKVSVIANLGYSIRKMMVRTVSRIVILMPSMQEFVLKRVLSQAEFLSSRTMASALPIFPTVL